jgi:hypothetical protein
MHMNAFITGTFLRIEDSQGVPYMAVVIEGDRTLLDSGWAYLRSLGLDSAIAGRHARDGVENAHITIANAAECSALFKYKPELVRVVDRALGASVDMEFHGIGRAISKKQTNTAWYGILSCEPMARLRAELGMSPKDFHVTLAFEPKDVFDSAKDMTTLVLPLTQLREFHLPYDLGPTPC